MPEDRLYCLYITGRSQNFAARAPAAVRRTMFNTGLPIEPADRLLQRVTGPVHLRSGAQLMMLKCQLKGLALVCGDQL